MLTLVFLLVMLCVSGRDSLICPFVAEISLKKGGYGDGREPDTGPEKAADSCPYPYRDTSTSPAELQLWVDVPLSRHLFYLLMQFLMDLKLFEFPSIQTSFFSC